MEKFVDAACFYIKLFLILITYAVCTLPSVAADSSNVLAVEGDSDYFERIKLAGSREINNLCRDPDTPAEVLEWIVVNKMNVYSCKAIFRHPNLRAKTIDKIIDIYKTNPRDVYEVLVVHPNISAEAQALIINLAITDVQRYSNIVSTVARHEGALTSEVDKLLRAIAYGQSQVLRWEAARSPRLPPDLLDYFVNTEEIMMRQHVTYNQLLSLDQLIKLANDNYRPVQTAAMFAIKARFPNRYQSVKAFLSPQAGRFLSSSLQYVLGVEIRNKNFKAIENLISTIQNHHLKLFYTVGIGAALEVNEVAIVNQIQGAFPEHYYINDLAKDENFNEQWLMLFHDRGWLERFSEYDLMHAMIQNQRWHLYWRLINIGYKANPIDPARNRSLFSLTIITPTVIFMLPIVMPLFIIAGCIIYVFKKAKTSPVTLGCVVISSLVFLPVMAYWVIAIGISCWGCTNPFRGVFFVFLLYIILIFTYYFVGRIKNKLK